MHQITSVYGGNAKETKPQSEVERLRARIAALEKENRMLKLRLQPLPKEAASTAGNAAKRSLAKSRSQKGSGDALWSLESWLRTIPMPKIVSNALLKHLRMNADGAASTIGLEQSFMDELGTSSDLETFMALLKDALVLEEIADHLFASARRLAQQKAAARKRALRLSQQAAAEDAAETDEDARIAAFRAKFVDEGAIELVMGGLAAFYQQLHGLVGVPGALSVEAMRQEHAERSDRAIEFTASNYGTTTTSAQEYAFVVDGTPAPVETHNVTESRRRQPRTVASFAVARAANDARLAKQGIDALSDAEFIAARLYTGPMFVKFNTVLRALPGNSPPLSKRFESMCEGNRYEASLHLVSAAIAKLGRIQKAQPVFRAPGGVLPDSFWRFNEYNGRGGIEYAFLSATTEREVAMEYAAQSPAGVIFEIHQAMVDRGADLSWLSQYPHEAEVTFPALTALEVRDSHVEGSTIVVEMTARLVDELDHVQAPEHAARPPKSSFCAVM